MKSLLIGLLLCITIEISAQDYNVALIPNELKENANAVVRFSKTEFFIENKEESTETKKWVVTIFNESGAKEHNNFQVYYDKFSKIKKIEGVLYNAEGKEIKKLKMGDINDTSLIGNSYDITDNRMKYASFEKENYAFPYTIEFSYERIDKNMLFFPSWYPFENDKTSIEYASFKIHSYNEPYRIKEVNINYPGIKQNTAHPLIKEWEIRNRKYEEREDYSRWENLPQVLSAPVNFSIESHEGNIQSWEDLSRFYFQLNKGRDELPEHIKREVKQLIVPSMNTAQKVNAIYQYMQNHTRYMSIQLGIGGWQTISAMEVADKGYGDCKALTNYTIALLKSINIEAIPALIYAGNRFEKENYDFPRMKFNHVIACIPTPSDTIWLECTSQKDPMGYQGNFTGNRKALLITEKGGKLVNTTKYSPQDNYQKRTAEVWLASDGKAKILLSTKYGSIQHERRAHVAETFTKDDQLKYLQQNLGLSGATIQNFSFKINKSAKPEIHETIELEMRKLASASGKRLFLKPNILSGFISTPMLPDSRLTNIFLDQNVYTFEDSDEIIFHLPENLSVESQLKEEKITSPFGTYTTTIERLGDTFTYTRNLEMNGGTYNKSLYTEWVNFVKDINKADKQRVVFLNEGT